MLSFERAPRQEGFQMLCDHVPSLFHPQPVAFRLLGCKQQTQALFVFSKKGICWKDLGGSQSQWDAKKQA